MNWLGEKRLHNAPMNIAVVGWKLDQDASALDWVLEQRPRDHARGKLHLRELMIQELASIFATTQLIEQVTYVD